MFHALQEQLNPFCLFFFKEDFVGISQTQQHPKKQQKQKAQPQL